MTDLDVDHRCVQLDEGFLLTNEMFELDRFKESLFSFYFFKAIRDSLACGSDVCEFRPGLLSPVLGTAHPSEHGKDFFLSKKGVKDRLADCP